MLKTKRNKIWALCSRVSFCSFSVVHPENPCWATFVSERRIQILLLFMKLSTWNRPQQITSSKVLLDTAQTVKWYPTSNSVAPMTTAKITVVTSSRERCHGHSEKLRLSLNNIKRNGRNAAGFLWMVFHCNLFSCCWANYLWIFFPIASVIGYCMNLSYCKTERFCDVAQIWALAVISTQLRRCEIIPSPQRSIW